MKTFFKILKRLFILLFIIAVAIVIYCFHKAGILDDWFGKNKNKDLDNVNSGINLNLVDDDYGSISNPANYTGNTVDNLSLGNAVKKIITGDGSRETETVEGKEFVVEEKNYDDYYNTWNFDDLILTFEGDINKDRAVRLLDVLIKDSEGTLYSKPTVEFNGQEIIYDGTKSYKNALENVRAQLSGNYHVSFGYTSLRAMVNRVIINSK